ncbi:MAG: carbohydrate ABC transporter permease [Lachnospiraceae bacterium]|nr:carbohydrate ABC transporter permease [Lachnospiraceae bacterium]MBR4815968.1 carbohydrate ABC transporter permease [Lachnospiraceae bacterium]
MEKNNQTNVEQSTLKLDTSKYHVRKTNKGLRVLVFVGLILWAFINLFPIYWMFTFSLKTNEEIFGENVAGLPNEWKWENYDTAFWGKGGRDKKAAGNIEGTEEGGFQLPKIIRQFINSVIITVSTILISIFAAMMATFAMSRIQWKLSKWAYAMFMLGLTIPIHASLLPVYKTISNLGLLNTYTSLILPYSAFSLAMSILICSGFMEDIPKELDEAAYIDGAGLWKTFIKVIVPLMKPALATIGIYTFLQCWNELMFANQFISSGDKMTLPVGVQQLSGQYLTEWGPIGAALVIATFPTLLVYVFFSKKIQDSFIAGAVKG